MTLHTYVPTFLTPTLFAVPYVFSSIISCPFSVSRFWSRSRLHTCRSRSSFLLLIPHSPTTSPSLAHLVSRDSHVNAYLKAFLEPQASDPPYPLMTPLRYVLLVSCPCPVSRVPCSCSCPYLRLRLGLDVRVRPRLSSTISHRPTPVSVSVSAPYVPLIL